MRNLKISAKILLGFSLIVVLTVMVSLTGIFGLMSAKNMYSMAIEKNTAAISALADIRELYQQQRLMLRAIAVDISDRDKLQADINELRVFEETMVRAMAVCEMNITDDNSRGFYLEFKDSYTGPYSDVKQKYTQAAQMGDSAAAMAALDEGKQAADVIMVSLRETIDSVGIAAEAESAAAADSVGLASGLQTGAAALAVVCAVAAGLYIANHISTPIKHMALAFKQFGETGNLTLNARTAALAAGYSDRRDEIGGLSSAALRLVMHLKRVQDALELVAEGDLTVDVETLSDSDTIGISVNKMLDSLNTMFGEVGVAAAQVAAGSGQVSEGAQSLALGATEQAAVVEQLSSSMAAVAVKTKENTNMAVRASELAVEIRAGAECGSRQMEQMLRAVKEIQEASTSIGNVIKVIDDIAFQTNILALNAAVEAARAGQHGKGFAVVAEEVRNLAAKSAEAATNTQQLIEDSMAKAEFGARIAEETAESLAEIVRGIGESGQVVSDIASTSGQQTEAITQINKGIEQVTTVIQANSAAAQESAAASEEMSGQSSMLEKLVERFKIKDSFQR